MGLWPPWTVECSNCHKNRRQHREELYYRRDECLGHRIVVEDECETTYGSFNTVSTEHNWVLRICGCFVWPLRKQRDSINIIHLLDSSIPPSPPSPKGSPQHFIHHPDHTASPESLVTRMEQRSRWYKDLLDQ